MRRGIVRDGGRKDLSMRKACFLERVLQESHHRGGLRRRWFLRGLVRVGGGWASYRDTCGVASLQIGRVAYGAGAVHGAALLCVHCYSLL